MWVWTSRGKCSGRGRRNGLAVTRRSASTAALVYSIALAACNSSSCNSSCSMWRSTFSLFAAEEHALQLLDQQNQALDLAGAGAQTNGVSLMILKQQRLQRSRIKSIQIGQAEGLGHVRSMSRNRHAIRKKSRVNTGLSAQTLITGVPGDRSSSLGWITGSAVLSGALQSMPSSSIDTEHGSEIPYHSSLETTRSVHVPVAWPADKARRRRTTAPLRCRHAARERQTHGPTTAAVRAPSAPAH